MADTQTQPKPTPAQGTAAGQGSAQGAGAATAAPKKDKAAKFKELAETRTTKAMNMIATLRGLANKNNYEFTEEQVSKVLAALRSEVDVLEQAFKGKGPTKAGFSL